LSRGSDAIEKRPEGIQGREPSAEAIAALTTRLSAMSIVRPEHKVRVGTRWEKETHKVKTLTDRHGSAG
jgi:hypothetical protein